MGVIIKVVPVHELDVDDHEHRIHAYGTPRDYDGELVPSEEEHAADKRQIAVIKRALAAMTSAQRRTSRWPTKAELEQALQRVSAETGAELWFGPYSGPWQQGSLTKQGDAETYRYLLVNVDDDDGDYYCEGHPEYAALLARAVAHAAGPQVTFLAEDYSPAEYTALFVPEEQ